MIKSYFKIAWRNLIKNKVYASINVAGLALSLTCGILIFNMVKYHLSFNNFHPNADRIYRIVTEKHRDNIDYDRSVPSPLGKAFREDHTFAEKVARIATFYDCLISFKRGNDLIKFKEEQGLAFVEDAFFDIFNYPLLVGDKHTVFSHPNSAIITQKMAKKYFDTENPIGKTITLDNKVSFQITGILKDFPENSDRKTGIYAAYSALKYQNDWLARDDAWGGIDDAMQCFALLRPNVSVAAVESVFPAYVKKFRPNSKNVHHYKLQPLADMHFDTRYGGDMSKRNLWILGIIGLFLVITAGINFINLATAQALKRSKEVGIRKALGSLRTQLFWQFIIETAIITGIAIAAAIGFSYWLLPVLNAFFKIDMSFNPLTDGQLAFFILFLSVFVTFFAGSYPALIMGGFQPMVALKGKLSQQNIGGFNMRRTLIVGQFALSQLLIICMVVIMNQMRYAQDSDLGFNREAIVMLPIGIDSTGQKMKSLKDNLQSISGVEKLSLCRDAPASLNNWGTTLRLANTTEDTDFRTNMKAADDHYLDLFGLDLAAGRNLLPSDTIKEFLVNETLVKKLNFPSPESAIGLMVHAAGSTGPIVGVVKDFHDASFHQDIGAVALMTNKEEYGHLAVKINMKNAQTALSALEKAWMSYYPDQIFEYKFLDEKLGAFYRTEGHIMTMVQTFTFIALFIGCLGLYGLVLFMVSQNTKEIGIRKVLGGSVSHIIWLFSKEFSHLILIAFAIAAPVGWWLMNTWLQDFKFRITITVWTFVVAIGATLLVAALTGSFQAIKAALANPVKSLRSE
jgi:putative ABC transport system permease protein